ncbi:MAG: hypothetical protein F2813_06800 [Actinobacteria bacterium]|uniref:Unannotated protein n=1 Tax=freshwater metagenome TaxID=449393 RepID=A0A6J5ZYD7_9ZZZZ|nr:hypothetical protein [Actinomycetota bacterium]
MNVEPLPQITPDHVKLLDDELLIDGLTVTDAASVTLARQRAAAGESLDELVRQAIEIGSRILEREQTASDTEFVKAEFEKQAREVQIQFTENAQQVTDGFKQRIDETFDADSGLLPKLLEQHFGVNSNSAVQNQVKVIVEEMLRTHKEALAKQFTADDESNPLAQFQKLTTTTIKQASDAQAAQLIEMNRALAEMQKALALTEGLEEGAEALAEAEASGTRKGRDYEERVADAIELIARGRGDLAEAVGEKVEGGGKKGDVVVEIGAQDGPARGRIAFEAKNSRLGRPEAIRTLDAAREQRSAAYAVLVVPRDELAPANFPPLEELHGNKIVVTYDPDIDLPIVLETGYALARARILMAGSSGDEIDGVALSQATERALDMLKQVTGIKRSLTVASKDIVKASENIEAMAGSIRDQLNEIAELTSPGLKEDET